VPLTIVDFLIGPRLDTAPAILRFDTSGYANIAAWQERQSSSTISPVIAMAVLLVAAQFTGSARRGRDGKRRKQRREECNCRTHQRQPHHN
jgi:hypothetical protein